jgi:hypothetical protein
VDARRREVLAWEARWAIPVALATFAAVGLIVAAIFAIGSVSGEGEAALLRSAGEHRSAVTLEGILQALGFALLAAPLVYLFRADAARSDRVRRQLIGLVVAAPLFLAASSFLTATATKDAATQFVAGNAESTLTAGEAGEKCRSDLQDMGAEEFKEEFGGGGGTSTMARCAQRKVADDEATNAVRDAPTRGISTGFGLAGRLGLAFALAYSCLWAMRVGLLTRFWGSLGMALGVAALLLIVQFTIVFFLYFGLLLLGRLPGGKPPAWAAGKAIPWPTPGEKAAASLEPSDPETVDAGSADAGPTPQPDGNADPTPRKRKQRD